MPAVLHTVLSHWRGRGEGRRGETHTKNKFINGVRGGDKSIGFFLDLSRERKGQEAEGERRALKLPAYCPLPTPPLLLPPPIPPPHLPPRSLVGAEGGRRENLSSLSLSVRGWSASCSEPWIQSVDLGARGWISTAPLVIRGELLSLPFPSLAGLTLNHVARA